MFTVELELYPPGTVVVLLALQSILIQHIAELAHQEVVISASDGHGVLVSFVASQHLDLVGGRHHFICYDVNRGLFSTACA